MIKVMGETAEGSMLLVLGLTRKNCKLLLKGKPISIDLAELGGEGRVLLIGGETEGAIARQMDVSVGVTLGSVCPKCDGARRDDGSCNCVKHQL